MTTAACVLKNSLLRLPAVGDNAALGEPFQFLMRSLFYARRCFVSAHGNSRQRIFDSATRLPESLTLPPPPILIGRFANRCSSAREGRYSAAMVLQARGGPRRWAAVVSRAEKVGGRRANQPEHACQASRGRAVASCIARHGAVSGRAVEIDSCQTSAGSSRRACHCPSVGGRFADWRRHSAARGNHEQRLDGNLSGGDDRRRVDHIGDLYLEPGRSRFVKGNCRREAGG